MDFNFNREQAAYRNKLEAFAESLKEDKSLQAETLENYRRILKRIAENDLFAPLLKGEANPVGMSTTVISAREILSRHFPYADFIFAEQALGILPILLHGTEAQKEKYLEPLLNGDKIAAFALTEAEGGSDAASLSCEAKKNSDSDYILNGEKAWISNAPTADTTVLFARTGEHRTKGVSAFIIDGAESEYKREPIELATPHTIGEMIFEDCVIKQEQRLGEEGKGFKVAMSSLDILRPGVGAHAIGLAKSALDYILQFTEERQSFDKPLAAYQSIQFKIAEMYTKIRSAQWLIYHSAWKRDAGETYTIDSSMAKMYATDIANEVLYECVQINGAKGVVQDGFLEKISRIVRPTTIYEGTSEIQKIIIDRQLRKMFDQQGGVI